MPVPVGYCFFSSVVAEVFAKASGAACVLRFDVGTRTEASLKITGMARCGVRSGADLRRYSGASSTRAKFHWGGRGHCEIHPSGDCCTQQNGLNNFST